LGKVTLCEKQKKVFEMTIRGPPSSVSPEPHRATVRPCMYVPILLQDTDFTDAELKYSRVCSKDFVQPLLGGTSL